MSTKKKNTQTPREKEHQSHIKTSYRIGALILVGILIVSLLAMYAL